MTAEDLHSLMELIQIMELDLDLDMNVDLDIVTCC